LTTIKYANFRVLAKETRTIIIIKSKIKDIQRLRVKKRHFFKDSLRTVKIQGHSRTSRTFKDEWPPCKNDVLFLMTFLR